MALQRLIRSTNPELKSPAPIASPDALATAFGSNLLVIMTKKRAGLGNDLLRLREEELRRRRQVEGSGGGMEVDDQ